MKKKIYLLVVLILYGEIGHTFLGSLAGSIGVVVHLVELIHRFDELKRSYHELKTTSSTLVQSAQNLEHNLTAFHKAQGQSLESFLTGYQDIPSAKSIALSEQRFINKNDAENLTAYRQHTVRSINTGMEITHMANKAGLQLPQSVQQDLRVHDQNLHFQAFEHKRYQTHGARLHDFEHTIAKSIARTKHLSQHDNNLVATLHALLQQQDLLLQQNQLQAYMLNELTYQHQSSQLPSTQHHHRKIAALQQQVDKIQSFGSLNKAHLTAGGQR